jgi:citrate lyase beta subunit
MRSKLFVPASRPELFAKAMASQADAISFDLEDSVDEGRKNIARDELAKFFRALPSNPGKVIVVRVNPLATPHGLADLEAICGPWLNIVNQPKPDSPEDVLQFAEVLTQVERRHDTKPAGILANIETPRALRLAAAIATASPRVVGLQIGWGDLIEGLDMDRYNPSVIESIQLAVRLAAGEARVFAYDGAFADIKNPDAYRREAESARRLGYLGKSAIHPTQVPIANDVFTPTHAEIAHALQVVKASRVASSEGVGAYSVNGRMVDLPFVKSAERVLTLASKLGLIS